MGRSNDKDDINDNNKRGDLLLNWTRLSSFAVASSIDHQALQIHEIM